MSPARIRSVVVAALLAALATGGGGVQAQEAGSVEGTVTVNLRPPRRSAARYPGGGTAVHEVQPVPAVVYLAGPVPGFGPARNPAPVEVAQRDTAFAPAAVAISVGSELSFANRDPFFHNVFSYSAAARFDLGRFPRGEAKAVRFDEPGVVKVYCEVHDFMRAVVVVTENPFHAVVGADGAFRIEGIPVGEHTFVVWHPDLEPVERRVRVLPGGSVRLDVQLR